MPGRTSSPEDLHTQVWRASSLGASASPCVPSGFAALDAELPGRGWPTRALSEILVSRQAVLEWRLLAPGLRQLMQTTAPPAASAAARSTRHHRAAPAVSAGKPLLLINPPLTPHLAGLQACGLAPQQLVWISAATPQQQLWATEQAIKSNAAAAVLAWLPQARPEQIRRLQSHALATEAPIFIFRPLQAQGQSSAAPLRLAVSAGGWDLAVQILKRRGPVFEGQLMLNAMPTDLDRVLTPRMLSVAPSLPLLKSFAGPPQGRLDHSLTGSSRLMNEPPRGADRVSAGEGSEVHVEHSHALARPAQPVAAH